MIRQVATVNSIPPGTVVDGKYRIISEISSGAFGTLYKAEQLSLDRIVALKILASGSLLDGSTAERFKREALALSKFHHQNIVSFYGYGSAGSCAYIAMELVEGEDLESQITKQGRFSTNQLLPCALSIARALAFSHAHGIVHRDLKPANILVSTAPEDPFAVKLIDFGLARFVLSNADWQRLTETGMAIGTLRYMSPEQCLGRDADARSDIYALGCVLYHCLTGRYPFAAEHFALMMHQHIYESAPDLSDFVESADSDDLQQWQNVIDKCMAKQPDQRYQSAEELLTDLNSLSESEKNRPGGNISVRRNNNTKHRAALSKQAFRRARSLCVSTIGLLAVGLVAVYAVSGEIKGQALAAAADALSGASRRNLIVEAVDTIYRVNGDEQARAAADALLARRDAESKAFERKAELTGEFLKLFERHRSMNNAAFFAESLLSQCLDQMEQRRKRAEQLQPNELTQLDLAVQFFMRADVDRETWNRLNRSFDDFDRNGDFARFPMQGQNKLEMMLHELESRAVQSGGAFGVDRQRRRAMSHWLCAMELARKTARKADFDRYLQSILTCPTNSKSAEYEIMARLLVAEWAIAEMRLDAARSNLEICRSLQKNAALTASKAKQLEIDWKRLQELNGQAN